MKLCERPGCRYPRVFFNQAHSLKVCLNCRMIYHSQLNFKRIRDSKQAKEEIETISIWLAAIRTHSETYTIEDLFKGFKSELRDFELKTQEVRKRLTDAERNDLFWDFKEIEKQAFEIKRQIDWSQMMANFAFHRFQINMDWAVKGTMNEEMKEDSQVERLLTLAKEGMIQDLERRYEERYNRRNEELKREYEDQYRAQIEEYKAMIEQQNTDLENHRREVNTLQNDARVKDARIDQLVEDWKNMEGEIESIQTESLSIKRFFEYYKAKTGGNSTIIFFIYYIVAKVICFIIK